MIKKAISFALKAHDTQKRKSGDSLYFWHSFSVARLIQEQGLPEKVVVASILHDIVEDTDKGIEEIEREFGEEVARLVEELTINVKDSWKKRKEESIKKFKNSSYYAKLIKLADKIDNLSEIKRDVISNKNPWKYFNAPYEEQKWYYSKILEEAKKDERVKDHALLKQYEVLFNEVFNRF